MINARKCARRWLCGLISIHRFKFRDHRMFLGGFPAWFLELFLWFIELRNFPIKVLRIVHVLKPWLNSSLVATSNTTITKHTHEHEAALSFYQIWAMNFWDSNAVLLVIFSCHYGAILWHLMRRWEHGSRAPQSLSLFIQENGRRWATFDHLLISTSSAKFGRSSRKFSISQLFWRAGESDI